MLNPPFSQRNLTIQFTTNNPSIHYQGTCELKRIHEERSLDDVEALMAETQDAIEVIVYSTSYTFEAFVCLRIRNRHSLLPHIPLTHCIS